MDSGLIIRPTGVAQANYVRPEPSVRQAVQTDLAPAQSVTASAEASAPRTESARPVPQPTTARDIVIDAASREVIFRTVDVRSGRVVRQVPDEALLRLKQYLRAEVNHDDPDAHAVERIA